MLPNYAPYRSYYILDNSEEIVIVAMEIWRRSRSGLCKNDANCNRSYVYETGIKFNVGRKINVGRKGYLSVSISSVFTLIYTIREWVTELKIIFSPSWPCGQPLFGHLENLGGHKTITIFI